MNEPIGPIAYLQLQRDQLITGTAPDRIYGTKPLVAVDMLVLSPDGPLARLDGGWVVSRHHRAHPANVRHNPGRAISVGFTGHYRRIRDRFGWGPIGVGGENIIVDTPRRYVPEDVAGGLVIRTAAGDVHLEDPVAAAPCVPFTRHLLRSQDASAEEVEEPRDFLRDGMRGFVMGLENLDGSVEIAVGDLVLRRV